MVDLGVLPSPLALSAFRMDSKFDLPAAISKLRYMTTKLRPRDGPTLQWRNEFVDLLAINALTDYISLPPPSRQSSYAIYPDASDAESAYTASMRVYQYAVVPPASRVRGHQRHALPYRRRFYHSAFYGW
jgi:hypothetical protein